MNACRPLLLLLLPLSLAGCLGSVDIGGTLSGLPSGASVTLQNNGTDDLTLTADGSFLFTDPIGDGESYNVTVLTQPAGATCTVSGGTGTVAQDSSANITSVVVTCTATSSISGTVLGLAAGVNLTLTTGTADLVVAANGAWAFPGTLTTGTAYSVTVKTQPPGQTCTVANGSGTFTTGTATAVAVAVTCGF
jgi:hypothetical protein